MDRRNVNTQTDKGHCKQSNILQVILTVSESLTSCFHEGSVEVEGEQRLWKVSEEVFEDTCNDVDVFYFVKRRQSLSSNQLLLQLFHEALVARDSVQANLGQGKDKRNRLSLSGCL